MTLHVTNLSAGTYNFYLYGHGGVTNENIIFQLSKDSQSFGSEATKDGTGWRSLVWVEGNQYVEFTNVNVFSGQKVTITVEPGASQYAILSGLQIKAAGLPLIAPVSNQVVNVNQKLHLTNHADSPNGAGHVLARFDSPRGRDNFAKRSF